MRRAATHLLAEAGEQLRNRSVRALGGPGLSAQLRDQLECCRGGGLRLGGRAALHAGSSRQRIEQALCQSCQKVVRLGKL